MDNEKKPEFLEKILKQEGYKAVNEDPALDQKKVLSPLKDETTTLPSEKENPKARDAKRIQNSGTGRGIGGGNSTTPNQIEGEYKTPTQKIMEKGNQRPGGGGRGGQGGAPIIKEPDEILHEKQDAIDPEDTLSKKNDVKQQKQETQQQQALHKPAIKEVETTQKLSVRERVDRAKEANEQQAQKVEKAVEAEKEVKHIGIRERIAKAVAEKNNEPAKAVTVKEKSVEMAMNKAKQPSPKSIKR